MTNMSPLREACLGPATSVGRRKRQVRGFTLHRKGFYNSEDWIFIFFRQL